MLHYRVGLEITRSLIENGWVVINLSCTPGRGRGGFCCSCTIGLIPAVVPFCVSEKQLLKAEIIAELGP